MEWFLALPLLQQIPIVLGTLDVLVGSLPDKYCRWPGILLAIFNKLYLYGKDQKKLM